MSKNDKAEFDNPISTMPLEYETQILKSDMHIVNRKKELECLTDSNFHNFIIYGVSCVGKTQLSKIVAKHYSDQGGLVFWHRIYPQTGEVQAKNFLELFASFLSVKCADNALEDYLKSHGIYLTNQLFVLIEHLLNQYSLNIFVDDMQSLAQNDNPLFQIFDIFLNNNNCKVYVSGWYIAVPEHLTKKPKTMLVEVMPMNAEHICEVARHVKSDISDEILMLVVEKSEGLPGIAEIIPYSESWSEADGLTDYFRRLLDTVSAEERILLFTLAISQKALLRASVAESGYSEAYLALVNRHIVKEQSQHISLHDKYRESVLKIIDAVEPSAYALLITCARDEPYILLNLLNTLCALGKIDEYAKTLRVHFPVLLKQRFDVHLLASIQKASAKSSKFSLDFLVAKMILLERQSQYDVLGMLIDVTQDIITPSHADYYMWQYVYMRYLYFKCDFLKILDYFYEHQDSLSEYPIDIYLQILFIIGRTYFIMGELRPSTEIYLFIFNTALTEGFNALASKAIHRICIIEEKLGLFAETLHSLTTLTGDKYLISAKRLAFSYYRVAKCHLGLHETDEAANCNNSSIEIKESLNSRRGLVFSHKLNAQIALSIDNITDALYWGNMAYIESQQLAVEKEVVATSVTYARALLANADKKQAADLLDIAIVSSQKLCLRQRLNTILQLCKENNLNSLENSANKAIEAVTADVENAKKRYVKEFRYNVEQKQKQFVLADGLLKYKKSLSQRLLLIF
jgi:hypothetical protein